MTVENGTLFDSMLSHPTQTPRNFDSAYENVCKFATAEIVKPKSEQRSDNMKPFCVDSELPVMKKNVPS